MDVEILPMKLEHVPTVIKLWESSDGVLLTPTDNVADLAGYFHRNPQMSFVAISEENVVGAVLGGHDGRRAYLHHLVVSEACRHQGIGTRLANACCDVFAKVGIQQVNLFVVEDNQNAQGFWRQQGFSAWPNIRLMSRPIESTAELDQRSHDPSIVATLESFQYSKNLSERATAQVTDEKMHLALDEDTNSIVVIMKHISGNLRSRWTDFLTSDGEKPWRNRDNEFVDDFTSRDELMSHWQAGWDCLFESLSSLRANDLAREVFIRGKPHSVMLAITRSLSHTSYHVGQIVQLARHHAGDEWQTLTIARGQSEQFNQSNWG